MKYFLLVILCVFVWLNTSAQELKVKSFTLESNDLTASVDTVGDLNGDPCALVKILMMDDIAKLEGFVIKQKNNYSEKWAYLSAGTKEIRIISRHHKPIKVYFPDYGVKGVKGKCTYVLDLEEIVENKPVESNSVVQYNFGLKEKVNVASANGDWKTIEQMAASGESMAYFPLAKHYLAVKKYDLADSFAQKAYSARVDIDKAKLLIQYLAKLGYYDDKEIPACLKK